MLRRQFIRQSTKIGLAVAGASAGLVGCASSIQEKPNINISKNNPYGYFPVKMSMDRVINTVVGLRPFRTTGYRLEAEQLGDTFIVHNYGHGGGGISLSWGTSRQAADMALQQKPKSVAVLGAGVMGLTTALILARKGMSVTVYSDKFLPNTTSNIAAALWLPTSYYDKSEVSDAFLAADKNISREAFKGFLPYTNRPDYGVYWNRYHLVLQNKPEQPVQLPGGNDLYPELKESTTDTLFGMPFDRSCQGLIIDPNFYLEEIKNDALIAGVKFVPKKFDSQTDILALAEKTVVNCTGLGAKILFNDEKLMPLQGQLTHLLPQPEINYSYVVPTDTGFLYMFPRKGAIVLGGTTVRGAYSTVPDMELTKQMIAGHKNLAERLVS